MFYLFISTFAVVLSMGSITHHGKGGPWPEPSGIWGALSWKSLGTPAPMYRFSTQHEFPQKGTEGWA